MRRLLTILAVAGAVCAPATPAWAHGGDVPEATHYRTTVTGISVPTEGLSVRVVEAGARLELRNDTGHSVEILGYSREPYLDVRPDGTWQNTSSPAAYLNETLTGDTPVPASADPTAPPSWRKISDSTTVRWHDQRTHWLSPDLPPQAASDPDRTHRLRDWQVPLRVQVETFAIRGTLDYEPPPRTGLWWLIAGLIGLATFAVARRRVRPVTLIAACAPLLYAVSQARDGVTPSAVLLLAAVMALAATWRHPPFFHTLTGACVALFAGYAETAAFDSSVLPAAGPPWLVQTSVAVALGSGAALIATGVLRLRAALPAPAAAPVPAAGLSSSHD